METMEALALVSGRVGQELLIRNEKNTRTTITRRGIIREKEINFYFRIENSSLVIKMVILDANHDWEVFGTTTIDHLPGGGSDVKNKEESL